MSQPRLMLIQDAKSGRIPAPQVGGGVAAVGCGEEEMDDKDKEAERGLGPPSCASEINTTRISRNRIFT